MPSHPERVRKNYCEHEWIEVLGVDLAGLYHTAKLCTKCKKHISLGFTGFENEFPALKHLQLPEIK